MRLHPSNLRGGTYVHGLRTPVEKITFTARLKIQSQSQILRYGIFCLPHRPEFSKGVVTVRLVLESRNRLMGTQFQVLLIKANLIYF